VAKCSGILAAIALASVLSACTPPDYGVVLAYTYDLAVANGVGEVRIVVPSSDGGVGPYSTAYVVQPDGDTWATGGATLGESVDAQVFVFDVACHLVAQLEIPSRTSDSPPTTPYLLTLTNAGAMLDSSPATGTSTSGQAPASDIIDVCSRTDPPMWGT
jgi:hypothetical protein